MIRHSGIFLFLTAGPALAHHPLAGAPMETFTHGLLSGIGHPILGFDHLFFVLAVGLGARLAGAALSGPLAYVAGMLAGCLAIYAGARLPLTEPLIAVSLLTVGGILMSGYPIAQKVLIILLAGFGLVHGAAFAESLTGQEGGAAPAVLYGYLVGLGLVQYGLAIAAGWIGAGTGATGESPLAGRMAGAAVAGVGLFLCLEAIEAPLVSLLTG